MILISVEISQGRAIQLSSPGAEALQGAQTLTVASSPTSQPGATILQCAAQPGDSPQQFYIQGGQVLIQGRAQVWSNSMWTCLENLEWCWQKNVVISRSSFFRNCRKMCGKFVEVLPYTVLKHTLSTVSSGTSRISDGLRNNIYLYSDIAQIEAKMTICLTW